MNNEVNEVVQPIIKGIDATKTAVNALTNDVADIKAWQVTKDERDEKNQKALDELIKRKNAVRLNDNTPENTFGNRFSQAMEEHFGNISRVAKGRGYSFELKTVGNMTLATNLTGSAVASYLPPSSLSTAGINFRDLVPIANTETGYIILPRESGPGEGSISRVIGEGTAKPQVDKDITMVTYNAEYIAGYVRISKQMLTDLPFLQTFLAQWLLRDFYAAESKQFYTDLKAVAIGSCTTSGTNQAEKLITYIANLGAAGFMPTGIVSTFANWADLLATKGGASAGYGMPGVITSDPSGAIRVAGVPYYPVNWITDAGKIITGAWNYATIAVADPLKVEFFEQDQDNVIKNLITVRVEAREVLVIGQPGAFSYCDK